MSCLKNLLFINTACQYQSEKSLTNLKTAFYSICAEMNSTRYTWSIYLRWKLYKKNFWTVNQNKLLVGLFNKSWVYLSKKSSCKLIPLFDYNNKQGNDYLLSSTKQQACKSSLKTLRIKWKRREFWTRLGDTLMKYVTCCLKTIFLLTLTLEIVIIETDSERRSITEVEVFVEVGQPGS